MNRDKEWPESPPIDTTPQCDNVTAENGDVPESTDKNGKIFSGTHYNVTYGNHEELLLSEFYNQHKLLLNKIIKDKKLLFNQTAEIFIESIEVDDLIPFLKNFSDILLISGTLIILKYKDILITLLKNNSEYHKPIDRLYIYFYSKSCDSLFNNIQNFYNDMEPLIKKQLHTIELSWYYLTTHSGVNSLFFFDDLNDKFLKECYPYLNINTLCKKYLDSNEPILILMGPPGTGKTRLIRYILKTCCDIKGQPASVMFTSDQKVIEEGSIFMKFIAAQQKDFLILEDIDYHMTARSTGNTVMYNFLSISNGIAVGHQIDKKIILSTNLPNISSIDEALIRPGRCFDIIETRNLYYDESIKLLEKLNIKIKLKPKKSYSLAELYNINQYKNEVRDKPTTTTGFV